MARRYGTTPDQLVAPVDLDLEVGQWFRLILCLMCVQDSDHRLKAAIQMENARGTMIVPNISLTDIL